MTAHDFSFFSFHQHFVFLTLKQVQSLMLNYSLMLLSIHAPLFKRVFNQHLPHLFRSLNTFNQISIDWKTCLVYNRYNTSNGDGTNLKTAVPFVNFPLLLQRCGQQRKVPGGTQTLVVGQKSALEQNLARPVSKPAGRGGGCYEQLQQQ